MEKLHLFRDSSQSVKTGIWQPPIKGTWEHMGIGRDTKGLFLDIRYRCHSICQAGDHLVVFWMRGQEYRFVQEQLGIWIWHLGKT